MRSASPSCWKPATGKLAAHDEKSATFRRALPELKLEIVKRYTLAASARGQNARTRLSRPTTCSSTSSCATPATRPQIGCLSARWPHRDAAGRLVVRAQDQPDTGSARRVCATSSCDSTGSPELQIDCPKIAEGKVEPMGDGKALAYAGVDGQYFSAVLIPQIQVARRRVVRHDRGDSSSDRSRMRARRQRIRT